MNKNEIHFLNEKSIIYAIIKPSDKAKNSPDFKLNKKDDYYFAEISLEEDLNLTKNGRLSQCKCTSSSLPNEEFPSVNSAYTKLSEKYETERLSHTTNVFTNFYADQAMTKSLDDIRRGKLKKNSGPSLYDSLDGAEAKKFNKKATTILASKNDPITIIKEVNCAIERTKIKAYERKVEELRIRLQGSATYPESDGPDSWQNWISNNIWIFGVTRDRFLSQAEGFGTKPDFIFLTPDGFLDVLEIKLPTDEVLSYDRSHKSYQINGTLSSAIGQVAKYRRDFEDNSDSWKRKIKDEKEIDIKILRPRGFILIGRSNEWNQEKVEYFRMINNILHDVQILTYNDLLTMAENFLKIYFELI